MLFFTKKFDWKILLLVIFLALNTIFVGFVLINLERTKKFSFNLNEEAKIIYQNDEYSLSVKKINASYDMVEIMISGKEPVDCLFLKRNLKKSSSSGFLKKGDDIRCFPSVNCDIYFKMTSFENNRVEFITRQECTSAWLSLPILPKKIIISQKTE